MSSHRRDNSVSVEYLQDMAEKTRDAAVLIVRNVARLGNRGHTGQLSTHEHGLEVYKNCGK